jgi:signal transduction histidine kinase
MIKRPKKHIWLLILVIISQLMLTGLLVKWLRGQWLAEKESLQKDINQEFRESVDQVLDSILVKNLIMPVLKDSTGKSRNLIRFSNKVPLMKERVNENVTAYINETGGRKDAMVTISIPDSVKSGKKGNVFFGIVDSTKKDMLLRSVKLIIRHTGDSVGDGSIFPRIGKTEPDTALLKKVFEKRIGKPDPGFVIRWISDTIEDKSVTKGRIMYFKSNLFERPFNAEVLHYQKIILKRISSEILFALVLLTVTGAAFAFAYRSLKNMETLNTLRNDFISNISHELKTPVSTVTVALEALKNFDRIKDPAKSNEYLEIASNELKRLDQLISQVLNTSVLEDQNQYLRLEEIDLVKLTLEVLNSMQVRFSQRKAKVDFKTFSEEYLLNLDKLHIQGVLINLLDNSLKYGSDNPEISVTIGQKLSSVSLTIRDNGPGIPDEYLSRVFDKFFRVPKGYTHDVKGYGLGLSFAYQVMRHHSGSIRVKNINGGGCEFILTFPKPKM